MRLIRRLSAELVPAIDALLAEGFAGRGPCDKRGHPVEEDSIHRNTL